MSRRLKCRACDGALNEDEFEYCDPCLLDMETGDEDEEADE